MGFKYDSGREFDTQNQFNALNTCIRENANRLCRGNTGNANIRRKDMIKILIEAAKVLKEDDKAYTVINTELEEVLAKEQAVKAPKEATAVEAKAALDKA